jgi:hypothetical protein
VQGRQRFFEDTARRGLAQLSLDEKVSRESKKYMDTRMAAEAAFQSASFAAMAARAAVELSRTQAQGKGTRGGGGGGLHPQSVQKSPSPSWSGGSTVTSVGSQKGKGVAFDRSYDEEEDVIWPPQPQRRPTYQRAASTMSNGGAWHGESRANGATPDSSPAHRRQVTELAGGNARAHGLHGARAGQSGQYAAPPYRRAPTATTKAAAVAARDRDASESAARAHPPYARVVSALERGKNEHIARHEEVRPLGTDARVMQERVYGAAPALGHATMNPEQRANSVRTR